MDKRRFACEVKANGTQCGKKTDRKLDGQHVCTMHLKRWDKLGSFEYPKCVERGCTKDGAMTHEGELYCRVHYMIAREGRAGADPLPSYQSTVAPLQADVLARDIGLFQYVIDRRRRGVPSVRGWAA